MLYMDTARATSSSIQNAVEFDDQRMDLVAVDRRGERAVQQRDHVGLDLVAGLFEQADFGDQRGQILGIAAGPFNRRKGGVGANDDAIGKRQKVHKFRALRHQTAERQTISWLKSRTNNASGTNND